MIRDSQITVFDSELDSSLFKYRLKLDKIKNELIKFGLSRNQAKVFIYLGKYGSKMAHEIASALQIPRTETYHILNSLQNKGIVTTELAHPTKYSAIEMRKAIIILIKQEQEKVDSFSEREEELTTLWKEIPFFAVETDESKLEKMQMLQGSTPIIHKIQSMIHESREDFRIFCSERDLSRFYHSDIFDLFEESSTELKLVISPSQKKPDFLSSIDPQKIRLIPKNTENKCFIVSDSKEMLVFLRNATHPSHRTFACWSDSTSLIDIMTSFFDLSWETAEIPY